MEHENTNPVTPEQDEDIILPEGYENENIFDEPSGDGQDIFGGDDTIEGLGGEGEGAEDPAPEDQPEEQKPEKEDGVVADAGSSAPGEAQEKEAAGRFKFKDGEQEVELQESDLPGIYRKAQEHAQLGGQVEQYRKQLNEINATAKALGFENVDQMVVKFREQYRDGEIKRLVDDGVNEEVARYMVESRMKQAQPEPKPQQPAQAQPAETVRDAFRKQLTDLMQDKPALREQLASGGKLPQEVITAFVKDGTPLRTAYAEYEAKEVRAEAERVRQENEILKQNEKNAARAPVKSVTAGGGTNAKGKDPFLMGFESDD